MAPDWDFAPEWARYTAMDSDGCWYWYENKPSLDSKNTWWKDTEGKHEPVKEFELCWGDSLRERPKDELQLY